MLLLAYLTLSVKAGCGFIMYVCVWVCTYVWYASVFSIVILSKWVVFMKITINISYGLHTLHSINLPTKRES